MARYKIMALAVIQYGPFEADDPEHADQLSKDLGLHNFEEVEWIDTALLIGKGPANMPNETFEPVPQYTTRDLWSLTRDEIA